MVNLLFKLSSIVQLSATIHFYTHSASFSFGDPCSSNCPSFNCLKAVSGAISIKSLIAVRVCLSVRCSKYEPNKNKKVTIADSS